MEKQFLRYNDTKTVETESKKRISIGLNVRRFTTDANGTIIPDNTVPVNMAVAYPFHLFGEFDRQSGFSIADKIMRKVNNTNLFSVYVWGLNSPLFFFNALADINLKFQKGDLIFVYVDDLVAPSYFSFVIVHSVDGNYCSLASATMTSQLSDEQWGAFKIFEIQEGWENDRQLDQLWYTIKTTIDSRFQSDNISPQDYFSPELNKQPKAVMPCNFIANQFLGLSSLIAFENTLLTISIIIYV